MQHAIVYNLFNIHIFNRINYGRVKHFQGLVNLLQLVGEPQDLSLGGLRLGFALRLVLKGRVEQGAAVTRGSCFSIKSFVKRDLWTLCREGCCTLGQLALVSPLSFSTFWNSRICL